MGIWGAAELAKYFHGADGVGGSGGADYLKEGGGGGSQNVKSNKVTWISAGHVRVIRCHDLMATSTWPFWAGTSYSLSRILSQAHAYAIYYLSIIFTIFIY